MADELANVKNALKNHRLQLLDRANVVAAGVGYKISGGQKTSTLSMVCSVAKKLPVSQLSQRDLVPATLDGMPTDVIDRTVLHGSAVSV